VTYSSHFASPSAASELETSIGNASAHDEPLSTADLPISGASTATVGLSPTARPRPSAVAVGLGCASFWRPLAIPDEGRCRRRPGDSEQPSLARSHARWVPFFHKPPLWYWLSAARKAPCDLPRQGPVILIAKSDADFLSHGVHTYHGGAERHNVCEVISAPFQSRNVFG
jgi:hypothetical protein